MTRKKIVQASPVSIVPAQAETVVLMSFYDALKAARIGSKITKAEWGNPSIYGAIVDDQLMIRYNSDTEKDDEKMHPWIIRPVDMDGMDWSIV